MVEMQYNISIFRRLSALRGGLLTVRVVGFVLSVVVSDHARACLDPCRVQLIILAGKSYIECTTLLQSVPKSSYRHSLLYQGSE
jgi:hypothetical protein